MEELKSSNQSNGNQYSTYDHNSPLDSQIIEEEPLGDEENDWAPNAKDKSKPLLLRCLCITAFLFALGCVFSMVFIKYWTVSNTLNAKPIPETMSPIIKYQEEQSLDDYINYAALKNGAKIIEEYSSLGFYTALGPSQYNKREMALSDDNSPGVCWGIKGSKGYLGIQLQYDILPLHFSIRHINIVDYLNAPKEFSVYSIEKSHCYLLGSYTFDLSIHGEKRRPWDIFPCQYRCDSLINALVLHVKSNNGGNNTCVYQFGVHGIENKAA
ncbi:DMC1_2 [Blepharisma stoltei]|uniref:SUN domain-containing protein n=1 Tax=Blepharisma stoltei TaxID=1481888 RepID=A0AAU9IBN0_9CILI|nr:unnamed protein product [Blepharisma stoltei]